MIHKNVINQPELNYCWELMKNITKDEAELKAAQRKK